MFRTYPVRNIYLKGHASRGFVYLRGKIRSGNMRGVDVVTREILEYLVYLEGHRYHEYASVHWSCILWQRRCMVKNTEDPKRNEEFWVRILKRVRHLNWKGRRLVDSFKRMLVI